MRYLELLTLVVEEEFEMMLEIQSNFHIIVKLFSTQNAVNVTLTLSGELERDECGTLEQLQKPE